MNPGSAESSQEAQNRLSQPKTRVPFGDPFSSPSK